MSGYHTPVMVRQVLELLDVGAGGKYLDATVGGGGHARAILEAAPPDTRLYGIDRDGDAIAAAAEELSEYGARVRLERADFRQAHVVYKEERFDGALLDLGISSHQIDEPARGFSVDREGPLDMRMDAREDVDAASLLQELEEDELARIIGRWGESRYARRIARRITERQRQAPLETTGELAELVRKSVPRQYERKNVMQVFQALRIAVNDELGSLTEGLDRIFGMLTPGGRMAVLSYHSLEDRIVKRRFAELAVGCTCPPGLPVCVCGNEPRAEALTRKPVRPDEDEIERNPRSRSALLRAVRKTGHADSSGERESQ